MSAEDAPDSLDPAFAYSSRSWQILVNTGAGLLTFRRKGGRAGATLVPDLAGALPSVSNGGRRYVFRLRPGARFSGRDGRRIRPSDVKSSIERLFAGASRGRVLYRGISGARAFERTRRGGISGIVARDESGIVEIRLTQPDPTFLRALALPFAYVVPRETESRESRTPPAGAGPYVVASHERGERLVLERSRIYRPRGELGVGQVDRIDVRFGVRGASAFDAIGRGSLDYAQDAPDAGERRSLGGDDSGARLLRYTEGSIYYFFMNTRVAPFSDPAVRRAVNAAIDRARLARMFRGNAVPTAQILPPGIPGSRRATVRRPDLPAARRAVSASGSRGALVTVWGQTTEPSASATRAVAATLNRIGLRATVKLEPRSELLRAYGDPDNRVQMGYARWHQNVPDGADFLDTLLAGDRAGSLNYARFDVPVVNRLISRARVTLDPGRRAAAWATAERAALARAPWAPFANTVRHDAVSRRVRGHVPHQTFGFLWMAASVR